MGYLQVVKRLATSQYVIADLFIFVSEWNTNRQHMLDMNLVPLILHRLTDHKLDKTTICKMGNVLAELLKNIPKKSDLKRFL